MFKRVTYLLRIQESSCIFCLSLTPRFSNLPKPHQFTKNVLNPDLTFQIVFQNNLPVKNREHRDDRPKPLRMIPVSARVEIFLEK